MRQKKIYIYEKHFYSLDALSRAERSIFISPPLLLFRNWKAGAVTCVYTLWSLFSPLLPRMSSLRTGADCLCLGPGKVAEAKCVQRRGSLPWDRSQDPSLRLLWGTRQGCSISHLTWVPSLPALLQGSGLVPPCLHFVFMRINDEGFAAF